MFEEIDRILFDNSNFDPPDSLLKHTTMTTTTTTNFDDEQPHGMKNSNSVNASSCMNDYPPIGLDNLASLSLNFVENRNPPYHYPDHPNSSVTYCINSNPCGIQDHLFYECKDWLSRFPHLRVVGKQIILSNESPVHHDVDSFLIPEFSNMINVSCTTGDTSLNMEKFIITDNRLNYTHEMGQIGAHFSNPSTLENGMEEEIFAVDGDYEEFMNGVTVNSSYNLVCNNEQGKQLSLCEHQYFHNKFSLDKEPKLIKSHQSSQHHDCPNHHGYHHFRHKHREKANPAATHSNRKECHKKLCILPDTASKSCLLSSPTNNSKALESARRSNNLENCYSESSITLPSSNPVEVILQMISKQLWNDLTEWMKVSLSENMLSTMNKYETNENSQKAYPHSPSQFRQLQDATLSRCNSSVDAQNSFSLPSFRQPKQTKHSNLDTSHCPGSQHIVQTNESNVKLADLLQISAKTLQTREKSLVQESNEAFARIQYTGSNNVLKNPSNNHLIYSTVGSQLTSVTMTTITTAVSRISPQSVGTISINRPISSLHNKLVTNVPRKVIPTCNHAVPEIPHHSGTGGVGVIGIAANLHQNGRLAPLDRLRTPLPSQYSSIMEEHSVNRATTTTIIHFTNTENSLNSTCSTSLVKCRNLNDGQLLSPVTVCLPLTPFPLITTTILHTNSDSINNNSSQTSSSVNATNMLNESSISSRNFMLPPLPNPTNILSTVKPSLCFPTHNLLNTELNLPSSKINFSVINKTGFGVYQNIEKTNQHTINSPHTGMSGNHLFGQQNSNSNTFGNTSLFTQRITPKSSTNWNRNSPKQTIFPLPPIDISKDRLGRQQKLWRPYSSRPSMINKSIINSSQMLTRACSTLLIKNSEICNDSCSTKISPAVFIGSTTNSLRDNDAVTR
ncbi:unnamed protein product [Schistosoma turkestanicum]|nr:unnamed protein product [Schistosoma turkestanicum]